MGKVAWCLKIAFFTLLVLILVSPTQVNPNAHTASVSSSKLTNVDSRLEESLKDLQPNDLVLVWVDIQAWIDRNNDTWLPADPAFYGIKWILITFDPDIEQNHLFWCLAEVEAERVQEISEISWVKNITLVRVGGYVRLSENPKLGMKGMEYAIQRAINEGNKSLHVVLYVENQTMRMQGELNPPSDDRDAVLENVTAVISELGGEVLRTGSYKNKLVARVPAHVIEETAENPYISVIYHVGPIVFGGGTFPERQNVSGASYNFNDNLSLKLGYFMILWLVVDLITAHRKSRRRRLTLYVIAILSTVFLSMMPSAQALWYSTVAIRANEAWDAGYTGAGVNVAVIDSGIDFNHPDFQGAIVHMFEYWDPFGDPMDELGHGTHVAGIIAGRGIHNNNFRGVAWQAGLVIIKVTNSSDLDDAINWVRYYKNVYNIGVLSLSWMAPGSPINDDGTSSYSKAVDDAVDAGIVAVVAAGNEGADYPNTAPTSHTIVTPGDAFNAITVGAVSDNDTADINDDTMGAFTVAGDWWDFSSRGPTGDGRTKPDVVAPGYKIISCKSAYCNYEILRSPFDDWYDNYYCLLSGTSMAAPHVAGVAALILQAHPDWTPNMVKDAIKRTARLTNNLQVDPQTGEYLDENDRGKGIVDAYAAVQASPDGTYGWDHFWVESRDGSSVRYFLNDLDVVTVTNLRINNKYVAGIIATSHLWINIGMGPQKYMLTDAYLVSGPRVTAKGTTSVSLKFLYNVPVPGAVVELEADYYIRTDFISPKMKVQPNGLPFSLFSYYNIELFLPTYTGHHDYVTRTDGSIIWNETTLYDTFHIRDTLDTSPPYYPWLEFVPRSSDSAQEWILRFHDDEQSSDTPNAYITGEGIYDTDLAVFYCATYDGTFYAESGPTIWVRYSGPSYPPQTLWYFHKETNPLDPAYEQLKVDVPCETLGEKVKAPGLAEHVLVGKWVTQPLPSQTIPSGTWTFHLWCYRETRAYLWVYAKIYKQHDSTQTLLATTNPAVMPFLVYGETDVTASFPETQMVQGDKIIVEVWFCGSPEGRIGPKGRFAYDTTNRNSRIDTTTIYL